MIGYHVDPFHLGLIDSIAFATVLGLPAVAMPAGLTAPDCASPGLPVGAQLVFPRGRGRRAIAVAAGIEAEFGNFTPPTGYR